LELLKRLQKVPLLSNLRLVGGTALALQLGHRRSIDLDFFGRITATGNQIADELYLFNFENVTVKYDTRNIKVFFINEVKVDIVSYRYEWIEDAVESEGIVLAGLKDIAAMKLAAITNRGTKKDFVDIYFLLTRYPLEQMLEFYTQKFTDGSVFNVIRSLTYFADAEENNMPEMFVPVEWEDIKNVIRSNVRKITGQKSDDHYRAAGSFTAITRQRKQI
jgi:predicted nucleotidyltransferase component of viral defense system